jgi:hypothetical protein
MTKMRILLPVLIFILAVTALGQGTKSAAGSTSQAQPPQPPPTVAATVDRQISTIENQIVDVAEAMP